MDVTPLPILERVAQLEQRLAHHRNRYTQKNQQIIDLVNSQKVRATKIGKVEAELRGLRFACDIIEGNLHIIGNIPYTAPVEDFIISERVVDEAGATDAETPLTATVSERETPEGRKEALRRVMEKWADRPETLPFSSARIATDTGLGVALDQALAEGVAGGWLSKQGDDLYRWIDIPLATTEPEKPLDDIKPWKTIPPRTEVSEPKATTIKKPVGDIKPLDIVYEVVVRRAGEPKRTIIDELVSKDTRFTAQGVGTYFGILKRTNRIRQDNHGNWIPIHPPA